MKKKLLVVMNHQLTEEQKVGWEELVILSDVSKEMSDKVKNISPTATVKEIQELAVMLVLFAIMSNCTHIAIMGEPTLVLHTAITASEADIIPVTATTERISVDEPQPDGSIKKISKFQHVMWRNML